jgi:alpha-N-arabinofuranosidase
MQSSAWEGNGMRSRILFRLAVFVLGWASLASAQAQSQTKPANLKSTLIRVDVGKPLPFKIPPTIFGTFLEPIGNSTYGGLWADVLTNPSFEENLWSARRIAEMIKEEPALARASALGLPLPWEPLDYGQGARYEPRWNDAANSFRSLLIMALPGKETGVRQKVYLPVHRVLRYNASVYVKHISGPASLEISLRERNKADIVLVSQKVALTGDGWQKYQVTLDLPEGKLAALEPADFSLSARDGTRVLVDQAALFPADAVDGMDPDMLSMSRAMKTPLVRFGGNYTSAYHWLDGMGPRDKRTSMLNVAWGIPEYNQFGTDEFLEYCKLIGAQPQIALNLGTGTPEEAAAWVKYVNEHWGDRSGGLLWELGNELWGTFQTGYPTIDLIAARTKAFSDAVRAIDPKARLIGTGGDPDSYSAWNLAQLTNPPGTFAYLSTHFVVGDAETVMKNPSPDFLAQASFALPIGLERKLRQMRQQLESSGANDVRTAFTEWLFHAPEDVAPRFDNMGGAIAAGGFLNMLIRSADIVPISDMTGVIEFGGIWKKHGRVYGTPAYYAFSMYSTAYSAAGATQPVTIDTQGETYDVHDGITRVPEIPNVPYLDVVAAVNDAKDTLTLFCVNRDLARDLSGDFSLHGFVPVSAKVTTLFSSSIFDQNDELHPEAVHPRSEPIAIQSPKFQYTFRHESVTVIQLKTK